MLLMIDIYISTRNKVKSCRYLQHSLHKEIRSNFSSFFNTTNSFGLVFLCIELHVSGLKVIQSLSYKERMVFMVNIIKQKVIIEESFKKEVRNNM